MSDAPVMTLAPNKYPGACFYCAKRVSRGTGACWMDAHAGKHVVAHTDCVMEAIADGTPPEVVERGVSRDTREAMGTTMAPRVTPDAWVIKRCREVLKRVTIDMGPDVLSAAVAELRAACAVGGEHVPF